MTDASEPERPITYFMLTGLPKSGNKWFLRMLHDSRSVRGFDRRLESGLPLPSTKYLENAALLRVLRRDGIGIEAFTQKLLNPAAEVELPFSERGAEEIWPHLEALATAAAKIAKREVPMSRLAHLVPAGCVPAGPGVDAAGPVQPPGRRNRPPRERPRRRGAVAYGSAGMHVPVRVIQSLLPSFTVLQLVRDPRDAAVSYFYHLMATLTTPVARDFVVEQRDGALAWRPGWKAAFARRFMQRVAMYDGGPPLAPERVHTIRYEDLLARPVPTLRGAFRALGVHEPPKRVERIVERRSFERLTGGEEEQRDSMMRKGKAGDWRRYFDRELLDALGTRFVELVREWGYASDDAWAGEVPERAPHELEFSRFRIRRSTCRAFIRYWEQSPELRRRFPDPWVFGGDDYFQWLCAGPDRDVQEWVHLARRLEAFWRVDIDETAAAPRPASGAAAPE